MFGAFRRFLSRSRDRELPPALPLPVIIKTDTHPQKKASRSQSFTLCVHLPRKPRPELALQVNTLRRQFRELQATYNCLQQMYAQRNINYKSSGDLGKIKATRERSTKAAVTPSSAPPQQQTLKQAANAHRMKRLRQWSQQHSKGVQEEEKEETNKVMKQVAWGVLADLQLENIQKNDCSLETDREPSIDERRKTEPVQHEQQNSEVYSRPSWKLSSKRQARKIRITKS